MQSMIFPGGLERCFILDFLFSNIMYIHQCFGLREGELMKGYDQTVTVDIQLCLAPQDVVRMPDNYALSVN